MTCGSPSRWHVSRAAITAFGEQQARSPSGPFGSIQSRSVTPKRVLAGAEEGDGAVDAAAHRDRDTSGIGVGAEDPRERVRDGVDGERLSADRRRFEQREPVERTIDPRSVRRDDAVALDLETDERELGAARAVTDDLDHAGQPSARGWTRDPPRVGAP